MSLASGWIQPGFVYFGGLFLFVCLFIICQHITLCQRCIGNVRWYVQQAAGCKDLWIGRKEKLVFENSLGLFSVQVYSCFMFSCRGMVYNPEPGLCDSVSLLFPHATWLLVSGSLCFLFHHVTSEPFNHVGQQGLEFCGLLIFKKRGSWQVGRGVALRVMPWNIQGEDGLSRSCLVVGCLHEQAACWCRDLAAYVASIKSLASASVLQQRKRSPPCVSCCK